METNGKRSKKARMDYFTHGRMRVSDGSNDMVVEYISTVAAAAVLIYLVPTGSLQFSSEPVSSEQVLTITLFQIVPEVFLDYYCTFTEVFGGLSNLHIGYWSLETGSRKTEGCKRYFGNLSKSLGLKLGLLVWITPIILLVATK